MPSRNKPHLPKNYMRQLHECGAFIVPKPAFQVAGRYGTAFFRFDARRKTSTSPTGIMRARREGGRKCHNRNPRQRNSAPGRSPKLPDKNVEFDLFSLQKPQLCGSKNCLRKDNSGTPRKWSSDITWHSHNRTIPHGPRRPPTSGFPPPRERRYERRRATSIYAFRNGTSKTTVWHGKSYATARMLQLVAWPMVGSRAGAVWR